MYLAYSMILNNAFFNSLLGILSIVPKFLYFLFTSILSIVDLLQVFFRSVVGLDTVIINGATKRGDLAYNIIVEALFGTQFPAIKTAFWSMVVLGLILLIIATFVANIRIEYKPDEKKGNSRGGIAKKFFTALAFMGIVPIATIFGLYLGNTVLFAIDSATNASVTYDAEKTANLKAYTMDDGSETFSSFNVFGIQIPTKTTPFSSLVFISSAYSCNRVRDNSDFYLSMANNSEVGDYKQVSDLGVFNMGSRTDSADMIDYAFSIGAQLKNPATINKNAGIVGIGVLADPWEGGISGQITNFNKNNVDLVWYYYDMIKFNWIVAFIALLMICKIMINICFDMIGRLVEIIVLFLAVPVVASTMPLNSGMINATTKRLVSRAIMAYSAIFCLNIVYSIIPILQSFKFIVIDNVAIDVINYLINTLILIGALKTVEGLIAFISKEIVGEGASFGLKDSTLGSIKEGTAAAVGLGTAVGKTAILGGQVAKDIGGRVFNGKHQRLERLKNENDEAIKKQNESEQPVIDNYVKSDSYKDDYKNWIHSTEGADVYNKVKAKLGPNAKAADIKREIRATDEYASHLKSEAFKQKYTDDYKTLDADEKLKYNDVSDYVAKMETKRQEEDAKFAAETEKRNKKIESIKNSAKYKFESGAQFIPKGAKNIGTKAGNAFIKSGFYKNVVKPSATQVGKYAKTGAGIAKSYAKSVSNTGILDPLTSVMEGAFPKQDKKDDSKGDKGKK